MTKLIEPSPLPSYAGPTALPLERVTHYVWGDEGSGRVEDWIYVSSAKIHQLVFGMAPGAWFRHSPEFRTVFAADEVYRVLEGVLVLSNPETGEVHRVLPGESVFFRRDTWHHGYSEGPQPLRVLEYFSPPPSQGTCQDYARTRPYLERARYAQDEWLGRWPMARAEAEARATMRVLRAPDVLWRLEGPEQRMVVGIIASTEHMTVGTLRLPPGGRSGVRRHPGDLGLYVAAGEVRVRLPGGDGGEPVLRARDGHYVPEGCDHEIVNTGSAHAELLFCAGPRYA